MRILLRHGDALKIKRRSVCAGISRKAAVLKGTPRIYRRRKQYMSESDYSSDGDDSDTDSH
jgi:hypothetical protein